MAMKMKKDKPSAKSRTATNLLLDEETKVQLQELQEAFLKEDGLLPQAVIIRRAIHELHKAKCGKKR